MKFLANDAVSSNFQGEAFGEQIRNFGNLHNNTHFYVTNNEKILIRFYGLQDSMMTTVTQLVQAEAALFVHRYIYFT